MGGTAIETLEDGQIAAARFVRSSVPMRTAMWLGATGVLVKTGMFREGDLAVGMPAVVLESIAELLGGDVMQEAF